MLFEPGDIVRFNDAYTFHAHSISDNEFIRCLKFNELATVLSVSYEYYGFVDVVVIPWDSGVPVKTRWPRTMTPDNVTDPITHGRS